MPFKILMNSTKWNIISKLIPFENHLIELINKVGFKKSKVNNFQIDLRNSIYSIRKSNKLAIFAHKTKDFYKIAFQRSLKFQYYSKC